MTRQISDAGMQFIEAHEGCKLQAYQDQRGIWTIGYGHTRGVYPGMVINQWQANQALSDDLLTAEGTVDDATDGEAGDNEFAAMVSLCFNIGSANFRSSSVLHFHVRGDKQAAADAFLMWDKTHIDGALQDDPGLLRRRQDERNLYLISDAAASADPQQKAA